MFRKIGLFILSLWLFFILAFIITIDMPLCIFKGCEFIGVSKLILKNPIPLICVFGLLIGALSYFDFKYKLKDSTHIPFRIVKIENINYEHLTFLTTYIVPLVCFNFFDNRYQLVLIVLVTVIGAIYIKTDLFYANPTLALLNYKIYKIDGDFKDGKRGNIVLVTRFKLELNQRVDYVKLDNRIYYAKPKKNE